MAYDDIRIQYEKDTSKLSYPGCPYCGTKNQPMVMDHIVPKSQGGSDDPSNKEEICEPCNAAKGSMSKAEFITHLDQLVAFRTAKK